MIEKIKNAWAHIAWFVAAVVVLIDPSHVYEWAHRHEGWSALLIAIWTALLAWAQKNKPSTSPPPTGNTAQGQSYTGGRR